MRGLEPLNKILIDVINRNPCARRFLHHRIDFTAASIHRNPRPRAHRKSLHGRGIIALVGAPHEMIDLAQCVDDLGGAGNQRDDTGHGIRSAYTNWSTVRVSPASISIGARKYGPS